MQKRIRIFWQKRRQMFPLEDQWINAVGIESDTRKHNYRDGKTVSGPKREAVGIVTPFKKARP